MPKTSQAKSVKKIKALKKQTRDANGRFGTIEVPSQEAVIKANYYDFTVAKDKLKAIKSMVLEMHL
jgi:hypothetical protein